MQVLEVIMRNALHGAMDGLPADGTPNVLLRIDPEANAALLEVEHAELGDVIVGVGETVERMVRAHVCNTCAWFFWVSSCMFLYTVAFEGRQSFLHAVLCISIVVD